MNFQKITQNKHFLTILLVITAISLIIILTNLYKSFHYKINKYSVKSKPIYAIRPYTISNRIIRKFFSKLISGEPLLLNSCSNFTFNQN